MKHVCVHNFLFFIYLLSHLERSACCHHTLAHHACFLVFQVAPNVQMYDADAALFRLSLRHWQQYQDALRHLEEIRKDIMDIGGWSMCKAQLLMATGQPAAAAELFRCVQ